MKNVYNDTSYFIVIVTNKKNYLIPLKILIKKYYLFYWQFINDLLKTTDTSTVSYTVSSEQVLINEVDPSDVYLSAAEPERSHVWCQFIIDYNYIICFL